jgi:hypothetical protein
MSTPQIVVVRLTKAQLQSLPAPERELLFRMGLVVNDLLLYQRLYLAAIHVAAKSEAAIDAKAVHALNLLLVLAGKVFEGLEVYRKFFASTPNRRSYCEALDEETLVACKEIDRIRGTSSLLAKLRNSFAFHYHEEPLSTFLDRLPAEKELKLYLGNPDGNTLHEFAAQPFYESVQDSTDLADAEDALSKMLDEVLTATKALTAFANGVADHALTTIFGEAIPLEQCTVHPEEYSPIGAAKLAPLMSKGRAE